MTVAAWTAMGGMIGVVITALVTYLLGRRKTSGQINTSEASTLWSESQAMRQELRVEVASLRLQLEGALKQIETLKIRINELEKS